MSFMARTIFPRSNTTRAGKERSTKAQPTKASAAKPRLGKAQPTKPAPSTQRRSGQSSLLLANTAQLRGNERAPQQDAQRKARRRRQAVRQFRQVEAVLGRVQLPKLDKLRLQWPTQLALSNWQASKLISLALLIGIVSLIVWIHNDPQWFVYREDVTFNQLTYLNGDELYAQSGLDSWNIFWLSPSSIRDRLIALPKVADAQVTLQLPRQVVVDIQEEQPVALWVTQEGNFWLLPDGTALPAPAEDTTALLQIIDPQRDARIWGDPTQINMDAATLQSTLAVANYLPTIDQIYFNKGLGLNFHLPGSNIWVYWGDGQQMERKYANILAVERHLRTAETQPNIIDVRFDKPVLK